MNEIQDIEIIGIPRALLYHRYGVLWKEFFERMGFEVLVSPQTDADIYSAGDAASVDESCIALKTYMGHMEWLIDRCDAVFVPSFQSGNVRAGFCTRYQSLPDIVRNEFRDRNVAVLSMLVEDVTNKKKTKGSYLELAHALGISSKDAKRAYASAIDAQEAHDAACAKKQAETFKLLKEYDKVASKAPSAALDDAPVPILLVSHPYIAHDDHILKEMIESMEELGACVIFADETDKKAALKASFEFSETLPWLINRELVGSILMNFDKVEGIVLVSAFPCGPDSMFSDTIMRSVKGKPILNIMIDGLSGSAGLQTRIESFMDILKYKGKGGYLDG